MTPCQEFRFWARRAPASERVGAGLATVIVVALVAWLLVPGKDHEATTTVGAARASAGQTAGPSDPTAGAAGSSTTIAPGATPTGGDVAAAVKGTTASSPSQGTSSDSSGSGAGAIPGLKGCASPPGSARGVTAKEIKVAVTLVNVAGPAANNLFGIPTPAQQRAVYDAVIGEVNAAGGVACRKLAPMFVTANPADQNSLQQACLDIAQAGVFAELDSGAYASYPQKACFAQHKIPYFGSYFLFRSEVTKYYPYLFNLIEFETLMHNTIFGLRERGFFSPANGFRKLGFIYADCDPGLISAATKWIQQAGVSSSQLVTYNVGCPSTFASPSDINQAVLKFKQAGVTNATFARFVGDFANFTKVAQLQGFRPQYGIPDEAVVDIATGTQVPDPQNIANAIAITSGRSGEQRTPGSTPSPATAKCDAVFKAHGLAPTYQQAAFAGYACDVLWMFRAAANNAPAMDPSALAAGLQQAKSVDFSFPGGPNDFSGDRVTTGGQFWRAAQFMPSCNCWQVVDRTFHPGFK